MYMYTSSHFRHTCNLGVLKWLYMTCNSVTLCIQLMYVHVASFPGFLRWRRKRVWIQLFAHVQINFIISQISEATMRLL